MYRKQVRRRRAVLLLLVVASLTLLSLYFREGSGGPLHRVQRVVATVARPARGGRRPRAEARPRPRQLVRRDLRGARRERASCSDEVAELRDQLAQAETDAQQREELAKLSELTGGGLVPDGQEPVTARVIGRSPTVWYSTVTIDKGTSAGVAGRRPGRRRRRARRQGHRDDPGHRPGDPDHRPEQLGDRAGAARGRDRRGRAQRRRPPRPAAQLRPARRGDQRGPDGGHRRASPAARSTRCSRPGSRSARSPSPPWRSSRPTSGSTCAPSPTCGTWTSSRCWSNREASRVILTRQIIVRLVALGLLTALLQVTFFAKIELFGDQPRRRASWS